VTRQRRLKQARKTSDWGVLGTRLGIALIAASAIAFIVEAIVWLKTAQWPMLEGLFGAPLDTTWQGLYRLSNYVAELPPSLALFAIGVAIFLASLRLWEWSDGALRRALKEDPWKTD